MKDFPIPVRTIGPGSQPEEDVLDYMPMPQGMETFRAPLLPEPEEVASLVLACAALRESLVQLGHALQEGGNRSVSLNGLPEADLKLINTVLGEGEVSALVTTQGDDSTELRVQESVFAGVWRVVQTANGRVVSDTIELGYVPQALKETARQDVQASMPRWQGPLPPNVQNAPLLMSEIEDQWKLWQPGQSAYVVNLTLLPMSVEDIGFMDHHLGTGRVLILSRGYGNCRITNTCMPNTWRVVYYNSQDLVILNTVEVTELPDVAQAAREDLEDSHERLKEVLEWVEHA
ncbi:hydrogenase expression/formation protein [Polaromonas naphthalenivorans]|uniref:HupH hydrogenase expression protein n=1 Tax=Polaromonas naphthalenivorans (strain CJ2) TaxID=365044 RepID=A1VNP9_POLNA|nr:hydrogenase expression/formation protein [Polaromonas naphthalenivorans]ABM37277.1 HupH hydrogenase expression protein [Polaromonas naphthalenivorans CJ2]